MKRKKVIAIEIIIMVTLWLIVAISYASAHIFNEEPEDPSLNSEINVDSEEDSHLWVDPAWKYVSNKNMEGCKT